MPLGIEGYRTIQERKDFYSETVSAADVARMKHAYRDQEALQILEINSHRTSTLYELVLAKEAGATHPGELAIDYLYNKTCKYLLEMARLHLRIGGTKYFIYKVDMAAGIIEMRKTLQFTPPKRDPLFYLKKDDYYQTQRLLREDPTGRKMMREAAKRVRGEESAYRQRRAPSGFVPEYMAMGTELALSVYNRVFPMARRVMREPIVSPKP